MFGPAARATPARCPKRLVRRRCHETTACAARNSSRKASLSLPAAYRLGTLPREQGAQPVNLSHATGL